MNTYISPRDIGDVLQYLLELVQAMNRQADALEHISHSLDRVTRALEQIDASLLDGDR
jgi:prefoldin subunit 5